MYIYLHEIQLHFDDFLNKNKFDLKCKEDKILHEISSRFSKTRDECIQCYHFDYIFHFENEPKKKVQLLTRPG